MTKMIDAAIKQYEENDLPKLQDKKTAEELRHNLRALVDCTDKHVNLAYVTLIDNDYRYLKQHEKISNLDPVIYAIRKQNEQTAVLPENKIDDVNLDRPKASFFMDVNKSPNAHSLTNLYQTVLAYQFATGYDLEVVDGVIGFNDTHQKERQFGKMPQYIIGKDGKLSASAVENLPHIKQMHNLNAYYLTRSNSKFENDTDINMETFDDFKYEVESNSGRHVVVDKRQIEYTNNPAIDILNAEEIVKQYEGTKIMTQSFNYKNSVINDAKKFLTHELPKQEDFEIKSIVKQDGSLQDDAGDMLAGYIDEHPVTEEEAKSRLEGNDKLAQKAYESFGYEPQSSYAKKDYFVRSYLAPEAMETAMKDPNVRKSVEKTASQAYAPKQEKQQFEQLSLDLDGLQEQKGLTK